MIRADYIQHMGTDLTVVNAARVSFDKESEFVETCFCGSYVGEGGDICHHGGCRTMQRDLSKKDAKLIRYLSEHNHWTPFSHAQITLRESVPIFVARQRFKHMIGFTYNEVSRRYVDSEPEFYVPEAWRKRAENKMQGSSVETIEDFDTGDGVGLPISDVIHDLVLDALSIYNAMLAAGVCPEQARMVLPQSMMTSYYVTGSLAAFARAYKLRIDPHAQKEIQLLAEEWDRIIRPLFPVAWAALVD